MGGRAVNHGTSLLTIFIQSLDRVPAAFGTAYAIPLRDKAYGFCSSSFQYTARISEERDEKKESKRKREKERRMKERKRERKRKIYKTKIKD